MQQINWMKWEEEEEKNGFSAVWSEKRQKDKHKRMDE